MDSQTEENKNVDEGQISQENDQEDNFEREDLMCRFYRNEWPENGDIVVVSNQP